MAVTLYPHQREAVSKLSNGKILWGGVGSGKSITAAAYYMEKEAPKDIYVITTAKKRDSLDWESEFIKFGVGKLRAPLSGMLTVDSWNNIAKYKNVRGAFFIFDEQRLVGSGAWTKAFEFIAKAKNKNTWILLSATPGDTWMDYMSVFIANEFYPNRSEFKDQHVEYDPYSKFPKVKRYHNVNKLVKLRAQLLVHMPYDSHTTRVSQNLPVEFDLKLLETVVKARWNPYEDRPIRNLAEFFYTRRRAVYSHPSRVEVVRRLIARHPRLIVFYNFDYELKALRTLAGEVPVTDTGTLRVWNVKVNGKKPNDNCVYVGRGSKWGNPFVIGKDGSREEVIEKYRAYLLSSEKLMSELKELKGKDLVCWCSPDKCHADVLMELANKPDFIVAEWNGHNHDEVPETDKWVYLVQYTAGSEGWNCTTTDAMLFYSLTYSYKQWHQAHGRIDRLNTPYTMLHYYILLAESDVDQAVMDSLKEKHSFNEVRYAKKVGLLSRES
jgi:hypothetical protein